MDENSKPAEAAGLPLQGPHWHRSGPATELPPAFVPLRLVLQPGGQTVELPHPDMVLGRHTDADLRLPLPDVSRRHCRCVFRDGAWEVQDLNSLNGTYVNGERVQQAPLRKRDRLVIGGFTFEVDLAEGPATIALPPEEAAKDGAEEHRRAS
jgi:pSer/pThr/pTyr-binding forkhead associated (FHA) protein